MKEFAITVAVIVAAFTGNVSAQIEPSSVKASFRQIQNTICDVENNCNGSVKLTTIGSQTFDLPTSVTDQFGPSTRVILEPIEIGQIEFQLNQDPKYNAGDEAVKINLTNTSGDLTINTSLKMSWKNGQCKVAYKYGLEGDLSIPTLNEKQFGTQAALPPGNPSNTIRTFVRFEDSMFNVLAESRGYFSYQVVQSIREKPLPGNGVLMRQTILAKSKQQVGEPEINN